MAYVSIYRRYRPFSFQEMVGQEHIVRILGNQIKNGQIGHAYLFTGTRGTGKTSVAKIFSRAINCLNPSDGSPCGECIVCKSLQSADNLDVIEIDAASNNGVDEIRGIRDSVKYPPVTAKYKVYIIDEVHMLSTGAFNALLKTLEEPPEHVVFILATTEVHKLPQTILSRCMRFDFRMLPTEKIAERLKFIFDDMGVKYNVDAVLAIAEAGDGSVRDALSIADMCVSYAPNGIRYEDVLEVLGASNPQIILDIIEYMLSSDVANAIKIVDELNFLGKNMGILVRDLSKMLRNLFVARASVNSSSALALPNDIILRLTQMQNYNSDRILRAIEIFCNCEGDMRYSSMPKVLVESAIARVCDLKAGIDILGLISRIKVLESKFEPDNFESGESIKNKRRFTPPVVLGFLAKSLRELSKFSLYAIVSELKPTDLNLTDGILTIKTLSKSYCDMLNSDDYLFLLKNLITDEFTGVNDVKIILEIVIKNSDKDLEYVKSLFDSEIIKYNTKKTNS